MLSFQRSFRLKSYLWRRIQLATDQRIQTNFKSFQSFTLSLTIQENAAFQMTKNQQLSTTTERSGSTPSSSSKSNINGASPLHILEYLRAKQLSQSFISTTSEASDLIHSLQTLPLERYSDLSNHEFIELLQFLDQNELFRRQDSWVRALISDYLSRTTTSVSSSADRDTLVPLLNECVKLGYHWSNLRSEERTVLVNAIESLVQSTVTTASTASSSYSALGPLFVQYSELFTILQNLNVPWKMVPPGARLKLLPMMSLFVDFDFSNHLNQLRLFLIALQDLKVVEHMKASNKVKVSYVHLLFKLVEGYPRKVAHKSFAFLLTQMQNCKIRLSSLTEAQHQTIDRLFEASNQLIVLPLSQLMNILKLFSDEFIPYSSLSLSFREEIERQLAKQLYYFPNSFKQITTSWAKMNCTVNDFSLELRASLMKEIKSMFVDRTKPRISSHEIFASLLIDLGESGVIQWTDFPLDLQETIFRELQHHLTSFKDIDVTNFITGLTAVNARWEGIPPYTQEVLLTMISYLITAEGFDVDLFNKLLLGLARLDYDWIGEGSGELKSKVFQMIRRHFDRPLTKTKEEIRPIVGTIHFLYDSNVLWKDLPIEIQSSLLAALECYSLHYSNTRSDDDEFPRLMKGLSRMRCSWRDVPRELKHYLLTNITASIASSDATKLEVFMNRLSEMEAKWSDFPEDLRLNLLDHTHSTILSQSSKLSLLSLNRIIRSFNRIQFQWNLDERISATIFHSLSKRLQQGQLDQVTLSDIPFTIYSLGTSGLNWYHLPSELRERLANAVQIFCLQRKLLAREVSNLLYGLARLGMNKVDLSPSLLAAIETAILNIAQSSDENPQHPANIIYSLAELQYSWRDLGKNTQQALSRMIINCSEEYNQQALTNIMYSLAVMNYNNNNNDNNSDQEQMQSLLQLNQKLLLRFLRLLKEEKRFIEFARSQFGIYCEWLELFPSELSSLLAAIGRKELPDIEINPFNIPSHTHLLFTEALENAWRDLIQNESEPVIAEAGQKIRFVNGYQGLKRKVFHRNIAVLNEENQVLAFIEVDSAFNQKSIHSNDGRSKALRTSKMLKDEIYRRHYPHSKLIRVGEEEDIFENIHFKATEVASLVLELLKNRASPSK